MLAAGKYYRREWNDDFANLLGKINFKACFSLPLVKPAVMNRIVFFLLFVLPLSGLKAQTFFYPNGASLGNQTLNSCDSLTVAVNGNFSDPCSYFPATGRQTTVLGNDVYLFSPARSLGCDSGWICIFVITPVSASLNFPPLQGVANGNYTFHLVCANMCFGTTYISDTLLLGTFPLGNVQASNQLQVSTQPSPQIGSPVSYTLTTNVPPNFTLNWYRNGSLANTTSNTLTWSTTLQTAHDSVRLQMLPDTTCLVPASSWSNMVHVLASPTGLPQSPERSGLVWTSDHSLYWKGYTQEPTFCLYALSGQQVWRTRMTSGEGAYEWPDLPRGIYILEAESESRRHWIRIFR